MRHVWKAGWLGGWHLLGLQMSGLAGVFGLDAIGTGPTTLGLRGASTRGIAGEAWSASSTPSP